MTKQLAHREEVVETVVEPGRRRGGGGPLPLGVSPLFPSGFGAQLRPQILPLLVNICSKQWGDNVAAVEAISFGCGFLFPHRVFVA